MKCVQNDAGKSGPGRRQQLAAKTPGDAGLYTFGQVHCVPDADDRKSRVLARQPVEKAEKHVLYKAREAWLQPCRAKTSACNHHRMHMGMGHT